MDGSFSNEAFTDAFLPSSTLVESFDWASMFVPDFFAPTSGEEAGSIVIDGMLSARSPVYSKFAAMRDCEVALGIMERGLALRITSSIRTNTSSME